MEVRGPMMWVLLMCYIFGHIISSHNNGFIEAKRFSKLEDLEIEKKLKTINKPAVKIIKTIDGERYGCVDFFKQPAFDHPSMKNHTYHYNMRPTWKGMRERKTNSTRFGHLWENGVGCPIGTVPIRRVTKYDLLELNSFEDKFEPRGSWNTTTYDPNNVVHYDQHHYAVGRTKKYKGRRFTGATMDVCVTAPKVRPTQFSASRLHMEMDNDFIQAGVTINPPLYKDNRPRIFVYTKAGGKSCYNSHCDVGIIMVRQDFPMGLVMKQVSVRGAKQSYFVTFGLIKDQANGNWWLELGGNAEEIGFWPSQRFPQSYGNAIEWGGEAYSPSHPSPPMGYGHFPVADPDLDQYIKRISMLDDNFRLDPLELNRIEKFDDDFRGYQVAYSELSNPDFGHTVFIGGPGNI